MDGYTVMPIDHEEYKLENYRYFRVALDEFDLMTKVMRNATKSLPYRAQLEEYWYLNNITLRFPGNHTRNYTLTQFDELVPAYGVRAGVLKPE